VASAVTPHDYLLFSFQNDDTVGTDTTTPTGARSMLAYHTPTRTWTSWRVSSDTPATTGVLTGRRPIYEHFTTYADQPQAVYVPNSDGGILRVDQCFAPSPNLDAADPTSLRRGGVFTEESDQFFVGSSTNLGTIIGMWGSKYFLLGDGDEFQLTDLSLEYMRYSPNSPADYITPSGLKDIRVWVRHDGQLVANRGGMFANDPAGGAVYARPEHSIIGRAGGAAGTAWRDQRFFMEKTVLDRVTGTNTLPLRCHGFQIGLVTDGSYESTDVSNPGARIYGLRVGIDGPTITPGYDK
jgi:hypothetical protein